MLIGKETAAVEVGVMRISLEHRTIDIVFVICTGAESFTRAVPEDR